MIITINVIIIYKHRYNNEYDNNAGCLVVFCYCCYIIIIGCDDNNSYEKHLNIFSVNLWFRARHVCLKISSHARLLNKGQRNAFNSTIQYNNIVTLITIENDKNCTHTHTHTYVSLYDCKDIHSISNEVIEGDSISKKCLLWTLHTFLVVVLFMRICVEIDFFVVRVACSNTHNKRSNWYFKHALRFKLLLSREFEHNKNAVNSLSLKSKCCDNEDFIQVLVTMIEKCYLEMNGWLVF